MSSDPNQAIREILQAVLQLDAVPAQGKDLRRSETPTWDSLAHVNLVFSIESELQIQFGAEELGELDSLSKLVSAAEKHLAAGG
jgi:acyl carrier protein